MDTNEELAGIRRRARRGEDLSIEEYKLLDAFWAQRPKGVLVPTIAAKQVIPVNHHKPGVLYCSFCDKPVPYVVATVGTVTDVRVFTNMVNAMGPNEIPRFVELKRISAQVNKIVACPEHALKIKARVDKDGKVHNCVKFDYI